MPPLEKVDVLNLSPVKPVLVKPTLPPLPPSPGPPTPPPPKSPKKEEKEEKPKDDKLDTLLKRLDLLEKRGHYQPRVQPMVIQGPTVTTTSAPGRGAMMMQQQQQQQGGKRKKKKVDPIHALRKVYKAQRKTTFSAVSKTTKERITEFTKKSKAGAPDAKTHKQQTSEYKKKIREKHKAFRKQFPSAHKIKEIATLRALIERLKRPKF